MTRLVAPLRFIRRGGRCRGCIAEGQLILLATEQNSRQGLVTSLVGADGIATCGLGLLQRYKLRRDLGYRITAVGNADFHARAASRPFHLILTGRELLASNSNGFVDLQRAPV